MIRIEHNVETGEVLEIELTDEEIADVLARQKAARPKVEAIEQEAISNAISKAALLAKLGITEEEAKLLLS